MLNTLLKPAVMAFAFAMKRPIKEHRKEKLKGSKKMECLVP